MRLKRRSEAMEQWRCLWQTEQRRRKRAWCCGKRGGVYSSHQRGCHCDVGRRGNTSRVPEGKPDDRHGRTVAKEFQRRVATHVFPFLQTAYHSLSPHFPQKFLVCAETSLMVSDEGLRSQEIG